MTENQTDRIQRLDEVMTELNSLHVGSAVKSMVVVQSSEDTQQGQQSRRSSAFRTNWTVVLTLAGVLMLLCGVWLARSKKHDHANPMAGMDRQTKLKWTVEQAKYGDADAALKDVESLTVADCSATELLTAASAFAWASARPTKDQVLAEHRAARAVLFLRRAVAQGYTDVTALRSNPDLKLLVHRKDFRLLLGEMSQR